MGLEVFAFTSRSYVESDGPKARKSARPYIWDGQRGHRRDSGPTTLGTRGRGRCVRNYGILVAGVSALLSVGIKVYDVVLTTHRQRIGVDDIASILV